MNTHKRGIFAIRGSSRPNPIGISTVRLKAIKDSQLFIQDVDIVDGTPLLDIKPYVPAFDDRQDTRIGWLKDQIHQLPESRDDGRFIDSESDS
jgi:tRNA (Thr-GGU) A37 N-methylase